MNMQIERLNVSRANVVQINDPKEANNRKKQPIIASNEATRKYQFRDGEYCEDLRLLMCYIVRIRKYLAANYGVNSANVFKSSLDNNMDMNGNLTDAGRQKVRDIYLEILQKEFRRTYKTAYAVGHDVSDILAQKLCNIHFYYIYRHLLRLITMEMDRSALMKS